MAEQILSQEEVDALLSAMDSGEVELEEGDREESGVTLYDLTSQRVLLRNQFSALEEVYDKFRVYLDSSLSLSLQTRIEVQFISKEMIKYEKFIQGFSNPTSFNIYDMDPLIGSALLVIEPNLVFSLIDCMFGGEGKPLEEVREFTHIETMMMKKFSVEILSNLEKAWGVVYPLKISLKRTETNPTYVHLYDPSDMVIIVAFSIQGEEFSGRVYLCTSSLMLEPIKDELSGKRRRDSGTENVWGPQLKSLIKETEATLVAELGSTSAYTVRDLCNLHQGDIIALNKGPEDPVILKAEGVSKYYGFPGVVKGSKAIQVSGVISQTGGKGSNG
ncbi:MAG: flagellar motor switch protein FliM [Desulfatiglans sp.]|jgi:flagellar motor switch protein FliM|nr:flagellar motor switch protein FliM [Thermodesulfobacteriota bacterium]MEE4354462.1 flagellar motor switch protein FliM [Desulfatiglans sp.]